jgi:hypothetical protein
VKTLFVVALLASTAVAHAEFGYNPPGYSAPVNPPNEFSEGYFNCYIVAERPHDPRERNPIASIMVHIGTSTNGTFNQFGVWHTARSGDTYDRSTQYTWRQSVVKDGWRNYVWSGKRDDDYMEGRLYYETNKSRRPHGWIYTEALYPNGGNRSSYQMVSDCWPQKEGE